MNCPIQQKPAGDYWGSATTDYDFNDIGENVHIWTLDYASAAIPVTSNTAVYPTGVLSKIISYDEKLNKVINYSDKEGRLILRKVQKEPDGVNLSQQHSGWLCTYYVYDDFGRLRYTITPKVVEYLDNTNAWSVTQSIIDDLCFRYVYDKKGRLIVKKQPSIGESYMVYDKKDRLVLTQHANQRMANNSSLSADMWSFTLYDQLNRDVAQGQLSNSYTRESIQDAVDKLTNETVSMNVVVNSTMTKTINANYPVVVQPNALNQPISGSGLINYSSFTHYDDYATGSVRNYGFNSGSVLAYDPASSSAEPTVKSSRVRGFVTGSWIKVLDNDNMYSNDRFMASSLFYDENGRALQVIGDNHKGNLQAVSSVVDFQTNQYDFSGKLLSSYSRHLISGGSTYTITSKNEYDRLGRLVKLSKNFNNSPVYKVLAEYDYDEFGQLKTKRLAPTQNDELEKQNYTYNLHGLLTGINKDYALSTDTYSQWDQYFSMYLDYVNKDGRFADRQTNGNLTGIIWRTPGDNTPRKFDFTYDRVGRLTGALFQQRKKPSETTWSNSETDFSVSLEYEDGNGNLKSLKQMGVLPGINGGVVVDDLRYSYRDVAGATDLKGNQLREVQDLGTLGSNNGILGDFKDGNTGEDYTYDAAGNLVKDLNKDIQISGAKGIEYNYLNKPVKITLQNKSTVEYTYDASGEKLAKKITNTQTSQSVTTDYIGDFVYKQSALQYILHEEGRVKVINPITTSDDRYLEAGVSGIALPNGKKGVFEYFLKDHLGSTRMVLTEEEQSEYYRATMENAVATTEEQLFGKVELDGTPSSENELKKTRYVQLAGVSSPWPNNNTDFVKLTAAEPYKQVGPNMLLKVMAGDKINATAKYFYYNNNSAGGTADPVSHVVNSLVNALIGPNKGSVTSKGFSTSINTSLNDSRELEYFVNTTQPSTGLTSAPKAFINIVFLDEQFHFIEPDEATPDYGTYSERVSEANNPSASFVRSQKAPKNGWVFVYLSNESNESVYFDDFYVTHEHGRIAQESHYYPNGLKIAGISSQAVNKLDTKYGYQGDFSEEESETGWDEFFLRNYDPQIGRWTGADPYDQYASSYVGMGNNPVNSIDPDGGENNDWIYNNLTHGWEWKDEIHNEAEFNASKYRFNYKYDKSRAKGNFDADFAGTWSTYHDDGGIEPFFPMKEVVIYSGNAKPFIFSGYQNARTDMPIPTNNAVISRGRKTLTFLEGVELGLYGSLPQYVYDGINVPWMGAQAMFYRQINSKTLSGHKANTSFDERLFNFVTFFSIPLAEGIGGIAAAKSPPNFRFDDLNSFRGAGPRDAIKWIEKNGWEMSGRTNSAGGIRFTNGRYGEQIRYMPGYKPGTRPDILKQGPYMEFSIKGQKTYVPLMSNPALRTL